MSLDYIIYIAFFALGFSVSELFQVIGLSKELKRIADRLEQIKD